MPLTEILTLILAGPIDAFLRAVVLMGLVYACLRALGYLAPFRGIVAVRRVDFHPTTIECSDPDDDDEGPGFLADPPCDVLRADGQGRR